MFCMTGVSNKIVYLSCRLMKTIFVKHLTILQVYTEIQPHNRVLLEKLTVRQLVDKFPAFCATRIFITAFVASSYCCIS